jgi:hypothetical protein
LPDTALKKLQELFRNKLSSLSIPNPSLVNYLSIGFNLFQTFDVTPYTGLVTFLLMTTKSQVWTLAQTL